MTIHRHCRWRKRRIMQKVRRTTKKHAGVSSPHAPRRRGDMQNHLSKCPGTSSARTHVIRTLPLLVTSSGVPRPLPTSALPFKTRSLFSPGDALPLKVPRSCLRPCSTSTSASHSSGRPPACCSIKRRICPYARRSSSKRRLFLRSSACT